MCWLAGKLSKWLEWLLKMQEETGIIGREVSVNSEWLLEE